MTVIARGIERPWSLLPLPDGDFLVGVRPTGRVLAIRKGTLDPAPVTGLPAMRASRTTGMLDMVLHPKFAENKWIYFTYHTPLDSGRFTLALARGRYDGVGFSNVEELYAGNPLRNLRPSQWTRKSRRHEDVVAGTDVDERDRDVQRTR